MPTTSKRHGDCSRPVAREIVGGHPHQTLLFLQRHRLLRIAKTATLPRLDLDEHQVVAVARDDVELAVRGAVTPRRAWRIRGVRARRTRGLRRYLPNVQPRLGHADRSRQGRCHRGRGSSSMMPHRGVGLGPGQHQRRRQAQRVAAGAEHQQAALEALVHQPIALLRSRAPWSADRAPARCRSSAPCRARRRSAGACPAARAAAHQVRADARRVGHQRLLDQVDRRQRRGARHRVAAERAGVRARRPRHDLGARGRHAERQPRRDALGDGDDVRLDAEVLDARTSCRSGPSPTALRRRSAACRACASARAGAEGTSAGGTT